MPVLLCLTCGEPAVSPDSPCGACGRHDVATVPGAPSGGRDDRLLARISDTLRTKSELVPGDPRAAAVRTRLVGQEAVLAARLASRAAAPTDDERAFLEYALARVRRALADLA